MRAYRLINTTTAAAATTYTDRQTDRQTDTLIRILRTPTGTEVTTTESRWQTCMDLSVLQPHNSSNS